MNRILTRDPHYYRDLLHLSIPVALQNLITFLVSFADNLMVNALGDAAVSGVYMGSQIQVLLQMFISGIGGAVIIIGAQYWGRHDTRNIRRIVSIGLRFAFVVGALLTLVCLVAAEPIIRIFTDDPTVIPSGAVYLRYMCVSFVFFCMTQVLLASMRCVEPANIGMYISALSLLVNVGLNYVLIFGKLGMPALGVRGAAIATVLSRFVELAVIAGWTHAHAARNRFVHGVYRKIHIPGRLAKQIFAKGMPLMYNEILWAAGTAILNQCYSMRGLEAVAATNISSTIFNVFNVVYMALGVAVGIVVGQKLGAGEMEEARETDTRMIVFAVLSCLGLGVLLFATAPLFPAIYNTTDEVRALATNLMRVSASFMPMYAFLHTCYYTLRSGGKTVITFFFDSGFIWVCSMPLAFCLARFTSVPLVTMYALCQGIELIKCVIGFILVKKGVWLHNLVSQKESA